jgi:hypothetical protein
LLACGLIARRRRNAVENIRRIFTISGHDAKCERSDEKARCKYSRRPGQHVRSPPRRHEARAAADPETATFRALHKHDADEGKYNQKMYDNDNGLHV